MARPNCQHSFGVNLCERCRPLVVIAIKAKG